MSSAEFYTHTMLLGWIQNSKHPPSIPCHYSPSQEVHMFSTSSCRYKLFMSTIELAKYLTKLKNRVSCSDFLLKLVHILHPSSIDFRGSFPSFQCNGA